jgi:hypothetical protein
MNNILVITGMHRSGTSLFTNHIFLGGAKKVGSLIEPDVGNPRGYYESQPIVHFHNKILKRNKVGYFFSRKNPQITYNREDVLEGKKILEVGTDRENSNLNPNIPFAFKDPRTCLFLPLWNEILSEKSPFFIFLFRHPLKVLESLLRRGTDKIITKDPLVGLNSWYIYNKRLYDFYLNHGEISILIDINDFTENTLKFLPSLNQKFNLNLTRESLSEIFFKKEFKNGWIRPKVLLYSLKNPFLLTKCVILYYRIKKSSLKEFKTKQD